MMMNESLSSDDFSDLSVCEIFSIEDSTTTSERNNKEYWQNFLDETVTVKFKSNDEELFTKAFSRRATINDIKSELINLFGISSDDHIGIEKEGESLTCDETMLADLGVAAMGIIELNVNMKSAGKLNKNLIYGYIPTLDVITVQIRDSDGVTKNLVVEIEDIHVQKPWLGGYRHRVTGKCYHHASTQTSLQRGAKSSVSKCSRFTQIKPMEDKGTNTMKDKGIQIAPYMFSLISKNDVILNAQHPTDSIRTDFDYESSENSVSSRHNDNLNEPSTQSPTQLDQSDCNINQLNMIKDQIETWKRKQLELLQATRPDEDVSKQRTKILTQSLKFLSLLNEYKSKSQDHRTKAQKILEKYAKPATLRSTTGATITVETVLNQKAKHLKELFLKYDRKDTMTDGNEKIILIHEIIDFFHQQARNDKYSKEIVDLLREHAELLNNGVTKTESLRARVRQRILHFLNYAGYNSIFDTNNDQVDIIVADAHNHDKFHQRVHHTLTTIYQRILELLQKDEMKRFCTYDSMCFTMLTKQFVYLVRDIWKNTSISLNDDEHQYNLNCCRMTRWDIKKSWSPWNCVLLPVNQLKLHWNVDNLESCYDVALIASVKSKHSMAKICFIQNEMKS